MPLGQYGPSITLSHYLQLLADIEKLEKLFDDLQFPSYDAVTEELVFTSLD